MVERTSQGLDFHWNFHLFRQLFNFQNPPTTGHCFFSKKRNLPSNIFGRQDVDFVRRALVVNVVRECTEFFSVKFSCVFFAYVFLFSNIKDCKAFVVFVVGCCCHPIVSSNFKFIQKLFEKKHNRMFFNISMIT